MTTATAQAAEGTGTEGQEDTTGQVEQVEGAAAGTGDAGTEGSGELQTAAVSGLALSDEDIMSANSPEEYAALLAKAQTERDATLKGASTEKNGEEGKDKTAEGEDGGNKEAGKADEGAESDAEGKDKAGEGKEKPVESDKQADKSKEPADKSVVDSEAELKRLFAPFKANGHEIQVKSVDDAISLMQQGANYNKKMQALKPNLKLMKMLESSDLLSEEKVGFLIDLSKKDPAAINKLIKESGINPMDLDPEKASGYTQTTHAPSDKEMDLDQVLDDMKESPSYSKTLNVVGQRWDAASKKVVQENPAILKVINAHMDSGIYDQIEKEVVSERLFGRLTGLSDIEAYQQVGDAIHARGGFKSKGSSPDKSTKEPVVVDPPLKKADDDKLKEKRRAASSTKAVASAPDKEQFNPLALSDEEFTKLAKQYV